MRFVNFLQGNGYFRLPSSTTFALDPCYQETLEASKALRLFACSEFSAVVSRPDFISKEFGGEYTHEAVPVVHRSWVAGF